MLGFVRRTINALTPLPTVSRQPSNPIAWVILANSRLETLSQRTRERILSFELTPASHHLQEHVWGREISRRAGPRLTELSRHPRTPETIEAAVDEIIRWLTITHCALSNEDGGYFAEAEAAMKDQWEKIIWPIIKDEDFTSTLDLASGYGRNTEMLRHLAKTVDLVDVNETHIEICKKRFGDQIGECRFRYHLTDGNSLSGIADGSMSFVYSFASMVHFDKLVVRSYVNEIARVLKSGGSAFLHSSNYGAFSPNSAWTSNPGNRSDMTADLMRQFIEEAGLAVKFQRLAGKSDGRSIDDIDCLTLLAKP